MAADDVTPVVLAGGAGTRLGGPDKPALEVAGRSLLDHVLAACPAGRDPVVVGPRRVTRRAVRWTREIPPGGGPLAGLAAGLELVDTRLVLVLAADLPGVAPAVPGLVAAGRAAVAAGRDGAWVVDADGRHQPLISCLAVAAVRAELPGRPAGLPVLRVLDRLRLDPVATPPGVAADVDTPADLARVRHLSGKMSATRPHSEEHIMTEDWLAAAAADLGIDPSVLDVDAVLDLARDVAHHVERKSAPLTAYLVGYAAASAVGSASGSDGAALARRVGELALEWDRD